MSKPTKEEYFKKKAEEHAREYRTFFEGLSDWEIEFIKEYEGIDGHSGLYAQGLLQMVSERVKKAHQAGYEEAVEEVEAEVNDWYLLAPAYRNKEELIAKLQTLKTNYE